MGFFPWYWSMCIVIALLYVAIMVWFGNGWNNLNSFEVKKRDYTTKVSVIVPFHNEKDIISQCVDSLIHQDIRTTEMEIILVDDHSSDGSSEIAKYFDSEYRRIKYIKSKNRGKKHALLKGVDYAIGELIITTDADCKHHPLWIASFVDYFEKYSPSLIAGPVVISESNSLLSKFQKIELSALVAVSAGAIGIGRPIMCSGANLAFKKNTFKTLDDPYNIKYSSGDDIFLLHKIKKHESDSIHFIKSHEATVVTNAEENLKSFITQRMRWTSKSTGYKDGDTQFTAIVIAGISLLFISGLIMLPFIPVLWKPLLFIYLIKTITDYLFFRKVNAFFKLNKLLYFLPVFELIYPFYVITSSLSLIKQQQKTPHF